MKTLATNSIGMKTKKILLTSIVMSIFFSLFSMGSANAGEIEIVASNNSILCDDQTIKDAYDKPITVDTRLENCLPAYRYDDFRVEGKFMKIFKLEIEPFGITASGIFSAANLIWSMTLLFIKAGLSIDLISSMAPTINNGIAALYDNDLILPIFLLGLLIIFYNSIIKPAFGIGKNNGGFKIKNLRAFISPLIIMGIITLIGTSSVSANKDYEDAKKAQKEKEYKASDSKGTIPWYVAEVTDFIEMSSSSIGHTLTGNDFLTGVQENNDDSTVNAFGNKDDLLTCDKYNRNLHDMFRKGLPKGDSRVHLPLLSTMWENTFLKSYTAAVFGPPADDGTNIGGRISCHYLETYNRVSSKERAEIINASGKGIVDENTKALQITENEEDNLRGWMAFALCKNTGSSYAYNTDLFEDKTSYFKDNTLCGKAFSGSKDGLSSNVFDIDKQPVYGNEAANSFISSLKDDEPSKVILGLISFFTSIVFIWTFGWLSIGLIFVNITSVIILTISPLILAASLLVTGERRSKVFSLFKLLGTAIVTKFLFTFLIVLLLKLSSIGSNMVQFMEFLGNGFVSSIVIGFMPLVALIVLRKILHAFSLGDILTAGGALALALNTQNQALSSIDKSKSGLANKLKSSGSKIPMKNSIDQRLAKFDRIGPQATARKALSKKYRVNAKKVVDDEKKVIRDKREKKREQRDPENSYKDLFLENMNSNGVSLDSVGDKAREVGNAVKKNGAKVVGGAVLLGTGGAALAAGAVAGNAHYNKLKNKKNKSDQGTSNFNPEGLEIKKPELGNNTKIAASARENNRLRNKKKQNLGNSSLAEYDAEMNNSTLMEYNRKTYGGEFDGFASNEQLIATAENYAAVNGYENSDLVLSGSSGLIIPNPTANRENLSNDQLKHWVYYLDKNTIDRKDNEKDDEYANRLFTAASQRGLISADGVGFNPLEHFDIDINSPQMLDFAKSVCNIEDNAFKISSKNSSLEKQIIDGVIKGFKVNGITVHQYNNSKDALKIALDKIDTDIKGAVKIASLTLNENIKAIGTISGDIKKLEFRVQNEGLSSEEKVSLQDEILKQKNLMTEKALTQQKELYQGFAEAISKEIGLLENFAELKEDQIKDKFIERMLEVTPMFDQIKESIAKQINTGESTLIEDLNNIHNATKRKNAEVLEITGQKIRAKLKYNFEKAGNLDADSLLFDFVSNLGSNPLPKGKKKNDSGKGKKMTVGSKIDSGGRILNWED